MSWRWQYIQVLLLALTCLSFGEISTSDSKNVSDQPLTLNLSQELVSRRTENLTTSSLFMEGGTVNKTLVNKTTTSLPITTLNETNTTKSNSSSPILLVDGGAMTDSWPESGHDKNSSIKARKGVSPNVEDTNSTPLLCACCVKNITAEQLKNCTCCQVELRSSSTSPVTKQAEIKTSDVSVNVTKTTTMTEVTATPTVAPSPVPHHHKPNVTSDVPEQQVPAKQEDYVIPVVGIIFAIPLIIILGALVFKKGADLWERRHYRRMDFLIDGIYNQ